MDLRVVQGTLKSLLQYHSSKASVLQGSAFFMAQLSYPYMNTGKTIALTRQTFVGKVMSLLFNMLSRYGRGIGHQETLKKDSPSLSWVTSGNSGFPRLVPVTSGRQGYWSGLPFPTPGDLPDPGIKPKSPASQAESLPAEL